MRIKVSTRLCLWITIVTLNLILLAISLYECKKNLVSLNMNWFPSLHLPSCNKANQNQSRWSWFSKPKNRKKTFSYLQIYLELKWSKLYLPQNTNQMVIYLLNKTLKPNIVRTIELLLTWISILCTIQYWSTSIFCRVFHFLLLLPRLRNIVTALYTSQVIRIPMN